MALLHVNFYSSVLRMASSMDVILPETNQGIGVDGQPPWDGKSLLPALYLLHGTTDDHTIWQRRTSLERYCAGRRLCVIMPNGHLSAYANQKYGHRYLDFITEELPDICSKMFRISTAREDTFIAGLSMGGYGALKAGLNYPERYAMVGGFSAGVDRMVLIPKKWRNFNDPGDFEELRRSDPALWETLVWFHRNFGSPEDYRNDGVNNLFRVVPRQAIAGVKFPRLYLACGTEDPLAWEPNVRFRALLEEYHVPYEWEQTRGVHEWRLWDIFIQRFLDRLPIEGNYSAIV